MAYEEITALLGGWDGFELIGVERTAATETHPIPEIVLKLQPVRGAPKRCSGCGEIVGATHEVAERRGRDLPSRGAQAWGADGAWNEPALVTLTGGVGRHIACPLYVHVRTGRTAIGSVNYAKLVRGDEIAVSASGD